MNTNPIEDFILANARNLRIAAAVSETWPKARHKLVSDFFERVNALLTPKLKGWNCELMGEFFSESYPGFYMWKPAWDKQYGINLECWRYGSKMIFGVWRDERYIKKRRFRPEVLEAVKRRFPSARARIWWEAEIKMHSPAADWRSPSILWQLHTEESFLRSVVQQLLEVATVVEPLLNAIVRKK